MGRRHAFTLVELLVVISIIALLIGILLPALGAARRSARSQVSLSNVRQWGVGTLAYSTEHKNVLPYDGEDDPSTSSPTNAAAGPVFTRPDWWANSVPTYLNLPQYMDLTKTPMPGNSSSIFVDPLAEAPPGTPYPCNVAAATNKSFFFCYIPNSKLNSNAPVIDNDQRMKEDLEKKPTSTVIMLEMRTIPQELPSTDPFFTKSLNRAKGDWQRFAGRHQNGGHILYGDGHAGPVSNAYASQQAAQDAVAGGAGWNKNDLIWNPLGNAN